MAKGHRSVKYYYEELAKEILTLFICRDFNLLKMSDKPDLQSDELSCGIEVVEGISSQNGLENAYIRLTFNTNMTFKERINKGTAMKVTDFAELKEIDGAFVLENRINNVESLKKEIIAKINQKSEKIANYKQFKENDLFVFCNDEYELSDIKDIVSKLADQQKFNQIFFSCTEYIIAYISKTNDFYERFYHENESYYKMLKKLKKKYGISKNKD